MSEAAMGERISELTFGAMLDRGARLHGDRAALVTDTGTLTHAGLAEQTRRWAGVLRRRGVRRGDRVVVVAPNSAEFLLCLGAAARLGAAFVPVNWRLTPDEARYIVDDADPALVVAAGSMVPLVQAAAGDRLLVLGTEEPGTDSDEDEAVEDDLIALMYTAAVSGRPLGAMMTHRAFVYQSANIAAGLGFRRGDVYANLLPLYHTAGLSYTLAFLQAGATVVLPERFMPDQVVQLIARHGVTVIAGTQPMGARVLTEALARHTTLETLRLVLGREAPQTMRDFVNVAPDVHWVIGNYGQTETHGPAAVGERWRGADLPDEIVPRGWESPLTTVLVADENDQALAAGEVGELIVRGPSVAIGYWRADEVNRRVLRNGWWHTGDLGVRADDGSLRFVARKQEKDFIKTGGENVYPAEVEAVLREHDRVQEVVVLGVPDPQWREAVLAVVVPTAPVAEPQALAAELIELCRTRLASYKKPREVRFVDALPSDGKGGIDRVAARQQFS
jgi:acyl-CoA synthetase (AMP-forming)/AMP-acid ligase II